MSPPVMGLTLGWAFCHVAVWKEGRAVVVPRTRDPDAFPECPWHVVCPCARADHEHYGGQDGHPCTPNAFLGVKRLLGVTWSSERGEQEDHSFPYPVVTGAGGRPLLVVPCSPRVMYSALASPTLRQGDGASSSGSRAPHRPLSEAGRSSSAGGHSSGKQGGKGKGISTAGEISGQDPAATLADEPDCAEPAHDVGQVQQVVSLDRTTQLQEAPAEAVVAAMLGDMRRDAEEAIGSGHSAPQEECCIRNVLITVPVGFGQRGRLALLQAAKIAGLQVICLVPEPLANVVHLSQRGILGGHERKVLSVHWGAGSVGVCAASVHGKEVLELGSSGDPCLGGSDLEERLFWHCARVIAEEHDVSVCEHREALHHLRADVSTMMYALSFDDQVTYHCGDFTSIDACAHMVTRSEFEHVCADLFCKGLAHIPACLSRVGMRTCDIDDIVLQGGTLRIPRVQHLLRSLLGDRACTHASLSDKDAVCGAVALAASLFKPCSRGQIRQVSKCPLPRVVLTQASSQPVSATWGGDPLCHVLIPPGRPYPFSVSRLVRLPRNSGTSCDVDVVEGDNPLPRNNRHIGCIRVEHIQPDANGRPSFTLHVGVSQSGILKVEGESAPCFRYCAQLHPAQLGPGEVRRLEVEEARRDMWHCGRRALQKGREGLKRQLDAARKDLRVHNLLACARAQERMLVLGFMDAAQRLCDSAGASLGQIDETRVDLERALHPLYLRAGVRSTIGCAKLAVGALLCAYVGFSAFLK